MECLNLQHVEWDSLSLRSSWKPAEHDCSITNWSCSRDQRRPACRPPEWHPNEWGESWIWGDHPRKPGTDSTDPDIWGWRALPDEDRRYEAPTRRRYGTERILIRADVLFTEFKSGIKSLTGHLEPLNTQEVVLIRTILVLPALTSRSRFLRVAAELSRDLIGCGSKLWKLWPHLTICGDTIQYTTQYTIQKYNNHVLDIFLTFCTNLLIFLQRYCEDEETRLTSHL